MHFHEARLLHWALETSPAPQPGKEIRRDDLYEPVVLVPANRNGRHRESYNQTVTTVLNTLTRALLASSVERTGTNTPAFQKLIQENQKTLQEAFAHMNAADRKIAVNEWVDETINMGNDRSVSILLERRGETIAFRIIPFNVRLPYFDLFRMLESPPANTPFDQDIDLPANRLILEQLNKQLHAMTPQARKSALQARIFPPSGQYQIILNNGNYVLRRADD